MQNIIKEGLKKIKSKSLETLRYRHKASNGDTITMKGTVEHANISNFTIERTKENGHRCSAVRVVEMPLTDKCINEIADTAVENL